MELKGKVAFITGAAAGLGKGYAEALLERGAKVFFGDLNVETGKSTAEELGQKFGHENVQFVPFDVTDHQKFTVYVALTSMSPPDVFNQAVAEFGQVDIMVNNAGVLNESLWQLIIKVNVAALIHGTHLATEHMRKDKGGRGGRIINISSIAGLTDFAPMPVYCATKHAVRSFTSSLAGQPNIAELGVEYGVLCPDPADTELMKLDHNKVQHFQMVKDIIKEVIIPIEAVVEAFLELLQLEEMNNKILHAQRTQKSYQIVEHRAVD